MLIAHNTANNLEAEFSNFCLPLFEGSTNVDDIQDELDGMLFGKHHNSPDSSTAASTTTSTTTEKSYNREVKNVDHQHFQPR